MGEIHRSTFRVSFNPAVVIEGRPERLSSNAGAILLREVDERLGWTKHLLKRLHDRRNPFFITHPFSELLRTRLYLMAAGWKDQDDADVLRNDGAIRVAVSDRKGDRPLRSEHLENGFRVPDGLSSQPTQSRLVGQLALDTNRRTLSEDLPVAVGLAIRARRSRRLQNATIDVDSFPVVVHGEQAGSAYNGHYQARIYHPILATLAQTGDVVGAKLRPGNVHSADGLVDFLLPLIDTVEKEICVVSSVRGDAGMPAEPSLRALEKRRIGYCFRLKANPVLNRLAEPFLRRPVGRPANYERAFLHELEYQADSWSLARRVVLVVLDRPGEIFPDSFFLVTNWNDKQMSGEDLLAFYRQRGSHEGLIAEMKSTMEIAFSCTTRPKMCYRTQTKRIPHPRPAGLVFACNEATLLLFAWAYNLANQLRLQAEAALPRDRGPASRPRVGGWSIARLRHEILAVPARLLLHSRRVIVAVQEEVAKRWTALAPHISRLAWLPHGST